MKRVRVSGGAERDLDEIWLYVARESGSVERANRLIDEITAAFGTLARAPQTGSRREAIAPNLRGLSTGNYIVYYREDGPQIVVSRVIHGKRDQAVAFRAR